MSTNEPAQGFGHRKGDHEMMPRHLALHLPVQPLEALPALTAGAVAVAAGTENVMFFAAVGAFIDRHAANIRAAADDCLDGLQMVSGHGSAELVDRTDPNF